MPTATMIVKLQYSDWEKFKPFLDSANAHRKQFSGTAIHSRETWKIHSA